MGPRTGGWSAVLVLVLAGLAEAQAPPAEVPKTGVTRCFGTTGFEIPCTSTGQDGDIRAGARWPSPRFTVGVGNDANCITDNLTGLMWPKNQDPALMTWDEAVDYGDNLDLCGHYDWRLANINELESLMPLGLSVPDWSSWFSAQGFGSISGSFWSSTSVDTSPLGVAWVMQGAQVRFTQKNNPVHYALPVRVAQAGNRGLVPRTGARVSYRWGDDSYYYQTLCTPSCPSRGVDWPGPRFNDNADGTVTDRLTGLMWLRDANCMNTQYPSFDDDNNRSGWRPQGGDVTWGHALRFVSGINSGTYALCGAGYADWRLPNRKELMSLVDRGGHDPALPEGHPFANARLHFWSSTPSMPPDLGVPFTGLAMFVDLVDGQVSGDWIDGADYWVWPVRGGRSFISRIFGSVTLDGVGLSGAILTLSTLQGATIGTVTTDAGGNYHFDELADGDFVVRAAANGHAFQPPAATVTVAGHDVQQDFVAALAQTSSINGRITTQDGNGVGGVSLTLTGPVSLVTSTDANGAYGFIGVPAGDYILTPARTGYTFAPVIATVTIAGSDAAQGFVATVKSPVVLSGAEYGIEGSEVSYYLRLDNQGASTLTGPLMLDVEFSTGLQLASEATDGWACQPGPAGHRLCTWSTDLASGTATPEHLLTFTVTSPPHAPNCGTGPSPCVTVRATLVATGDTAIVYTGLDNAGGTGNSIPRATDDVAWVYGDLTFSPLSNDDDPDGDTLTITGIDVAPQAGDVALNANGTVTYTPHGGLLTGPDSFRYRVSDGRGGSATALVSINSVTPGLTSGKAAIDAGPVAPGRLVSGWTHITSAWGLSVEVAFEPVAAGDIPAALGAAGYDAALVPQAVSDPGAFRGEPLYFMADAWSAGVASLPPSRWTQVYFRPSQAIGRISVARAVFRAYYVRESVPGTLLNTTTAYVIGMSGDPGAVPVMARDDAVATPADTPIEVDVLANDVSLAGRALSIGSLGASSNLEAWVFDGVEGSAVGTVNWTADGRRVVFTPLPGFVGTTSFTYGMREAPCPATSPCSYDDNLHYATVTVTVGGTPTTPDLAADKEVFDEATGAWLRADPLQVGGRTRVGNGALVRFRLVVMNLGQGPTTGLISVTDALPAELTVEGPVTLTHLPSGVSPSVPANAGCLVLPAGGIQPTETLACNLTGRLSPAEWVSYEFAARVGASAAAVGQLVPLDNRAGVSTPDDANPADNLSNPVTVTVQGPAGTLLPGGGTMTITVPQSQVLSGVAVAPSTSTPPAGVIFPFGAISYAVMLGPTETVSAATMTFTPPLTPRLILYKADTNGVVLGIIPPCDGTTIVSDCWTRQDTAASTIIVLTLTDNGPFDLNPTAGVIEDPVLFGTEITNSPPVADAGSNQVVLYAPGLLVQLDGSASRDPFNEPITYRWTIASAPDGITGTVLAGVKPSFAPGVPGVYEISLVVNDGALDSAADTVAIRVTDSPMLAAVSRVAINTSAGDQFDPHVDGDLASFSETTSTLQIHYYRFSTGVDAVIPNSLGSGSVEMDLLSDVQGERIAFTRIHPDRNAIMLFDATTRSLVEVNPEPGSNRLGVAIGGPTLAYTDNGLHANGEIVVVDLAPGGQATRLTSDAAYDQNPSVSTNGQVVVWEHCPASLGACEIRQAVKQADGGWAVSDVTSTTPAEANPETNGDVVVYESYRGSASDGYDLFFRAVSGGPETHLSLPGDQTHASVAGDLFVFEHRDAPTESAPPPRSDIFMYDLATGRFFQITATPDVDESLNDVTVLSDGGIRIVWDANDDPARNIYAATLHLSDLYLSAPPIPAGVFADGVSPDRGTASTLFAFKAVYTSRSNLPPQPGVAVVVDGAPRDMALDTLAPPVLQDGDYTNGEQYTFTTTLAVGAHTYYFKAGNGLIGVYWPVASSPPFSGPAVSDLTVTFVPCVPSQPQYVCSPRFVASGGTGPYTYTGFELPAGVTVDPATGILSGVFAPGTYAVTVRVTDAAGDVYDWTWTFTIADMTPPVVTPPPDITLTVAEGALTPLAALGVATAIDDVGGVLTPGASPAGPLRPGFYTVTWSATDAAGNTGTAVQRVTINTPSHVYGLSVPGEDRRMDLSVPAAQTIVNAAWSLADPPPPGVISSFGALSYTVTLAPGEASTLATITFAPALPSSLVTLLRMALYKTDRAGVVQGVIPVCNGTTIATDCWTREDTATSTTIVLTLTDNGPFDLNPAAGVIEDPVVLASLANGPPTADAGADQTLEAASASGAAVTLGGSGTDPDGDALTFAWTGPCGSAPTAAATLTCPLGTSTMTLTVSDGYEGVATASVRVTVHDTTPPAVVCGAADTAWHAADVTIGCWAKDDGVGLANPADASFLLATAVSPGTETASATTGTRSVCDAAGNCATAGPIGLIKVDKLAPSIAVTTPSGGAIYILNQAVAASVACADGGAGIAGCTGPVEDGALVDTGTVGAKTFVVTASDAAGNRSSATVDYSVRFASAGNCLWNTGHQILWPIAANGTSVFSRGLPVPARFRVCDARGQSVGTAGVVTDFKLVQTRSDGVTQALNTDVPAVVPPPVFTWDPLLKEWVFLIDTRPYARGTTYFFRVTLSDATFVDFGFAMK